MRTTTGAAAAVAAALLLAGCGGGSAGTPSFSPLPTSPSSSSSPSATASGTPSGTPAPAGYAPLTGLAVTSAAALARPVVAVPVALVPGSATAGLGAADVVYQEFDRPGRSRLLALYQSADAPSVAPVTSTSPVDMRLLFLLDRPVYGYAGGTTGFVMQAQRGPVTGRPATDFPALYRGPASHRVTSSSALRASAPKAAAPSAGTLTFASTGAPLPTNGGTLHRVVVTVPGHAAESFTWNGRTWTGPGGTSLANLVVQVVAYKTITPHKGPTVHSAQVLGAGTATVVARDHAVKVSWERTQPGQVTAYRVGVVPVGLAPGRTWLLLVPSGTRMTLS